MAWVCAAVLRRDKSRCAAGVAACRDNGAVAVDDEVGENVAVDVDVDDEVDDDDDADEVDVVIAGAVAAFGMTVGLQK